MSDAGPDGDEGPALDRLGPALEDVLRDGRTNAVLAWLLVGVLAAALAESLLDVDLEWIAFVAGTGAVVLAPPVAYRDWRVMLPWELLVLALLPILVRGVFGGEVGTFATYLAVAALALVITVELHMFTELQVTHWFAVLLVVCATMATGAVNVMVRWTFDRYLATDYLTDIDALMEHLFWITAAGLAAGVLFDAYFRRRDRQLRRAIQRALPVGGRL